MTQREGRGRRERERKREKERKKETEPVADTHATAYEFGLQDTCTHTCIMSPLTLILTSNGCIAEKGALQFESYLRSHTLGA